MIHPSKVSLIVAGDFGLISPILRIEQLKFNSDFPLDCVTQKSKALRGRFEDDVLVDRKPPFRSEIEDNSSILKGDTHGLIQCSQIILLLRHHALPFTSGDELSWIGPLAPQRLDELLD